MDFDFSGNAKQFPQNHNGENHSVLEPSWNLLKETEIHKYLAYSDSHYFLINQPLNNVHTLFHRVCAVLLKKNEER